MIEMDEQAAANREVPASAPTPPPTSAPIPIPTPTPETDRPLQDPGSRKVIQPTAAILQELQSQSREAEPSNPVPAASPSGAAVPPPPVSDPGHKPAAFPTATPTPAATPLIVTSDHEPQPQSYSQPLTPAKAGGSFSRLKLLLVLLVVVGLAGGSGGYAVSQINKTQKPFLVHGSDTSKWVEYSSPDNSFSASFPTAPVTIPQTTQTDHGVTYTINGTHVGNNSTAYQAVYITYLNGATIPSGTAGLQAAIQVEENNLQNSQLVSSSYTTVSGHQAEQYELTGIWKGANYDFTGVVVPVGNVLYTAAAIQSGDSQAPNAQHFIDSFKIGQ